MAHLTTDSLLARASRHVLENGPDGELFACALFGREADRMAAFTETWAGRSDTLEAFDPSKDMILAMRVSSECEHLHVATVNASSGNVQEVATLEVSDMGWSDLFPKRAFESIVAPLSTFGVSSVDQVDPYDVVDALFEHSIELELGAQRGTRFASLDDAASA